MQRGSFCFCPCRAYHSGCGSPRVSAHVVRLALGWVLLGFQPEWARAVKKVSKVFKVFKVARGNSSDFGEIVSKVFLLSDFSFHTSFFRNHLRRPYAQHLVEVVTYDEEDDKGGDDEGTEDGDDGGEALCHTIDKTVSCPVF